MKEIPRTCEDCVFCYMRGNGYYCGCPTSDEEEVELWYIACEEFGEEEI